jgi:hypothetical protein
MAERTTLMVQPDELKSEKPLVWLQEQDPKYGNCFAPARLAISKQLSDW